MKEKFINELNNLGYKTSVTEKFVVFDYVIQAGKFKDRQIKLGFEIVEFPIAIPHGPHFSPLLVPINQKGGHPGRIHASELFKDNGGHLSRPYPNDSKKTVKDYMIYIGYLFNTL
ncbi:hypothetical protein KAJ89_02425 [Candidatus Parcubacteria bacterium]|nr:hypothetical protein [Candidatus Parcubacteria bacterium]